MLAAILATVAWLAFAATSAQALSQRGHTFSFAFGSPGGSTGQLDDPSGVAVSDASGEVYVADTRNGRVEVFAPELGPHGEVVGEHYVEELKVPYPQEIAVDNSGSEADPSKGDIYVVGTTAEEAQEAEPEDKIVYKFSPAGALIGKLKKFKLPEKGSEAEEFEIVDGVAVNAAGNLFVYQEDNLIDEFDDAETNAGVSSLPTEAGEGKHGLAVDASGNFYAGTGELGGGEPFERELTEQRAEEDEHDGLASGTFDVAARINGASGAAAEPAELDGEDTSSVAINTATKEANEVNEAGDVYLANIGFLDGEPHSSVAAFSPPSQAHPKGELIQRLSAAGLREGTGVAVDPASGDVYVSDARSDDVDVFELEAPSAPTVSGLSACTLEAGGAGGCTQAAGAATLKAQVDPRGQATSYQFEYGDGDCSAVPSPCTATTSTAIGSGWADVSASAQVTGLASGTFHYRVLARSAKGIVRSAERTFAIVAAVGALPDARAWELVSDGQKLGATAEAITTGGAIQSSLSGNAITYVGEGIITSGSEPEGNRNPEYTQELSARSSSAWGTEDIATPNTSGSGLHVGSPPEYQAFSPNLALAIVQPFEGSAFSGGLAEPPLSPPLTAEEEGKQEKTVYLRDDAPEELLTPSGSEASSYDKARENGKVMKNAGFLALVTHADSPGGLPFGGGNNGRSEGIEFLGATEDLGHAVFASRRALPGLYEWGPDGTVRLISELPSGERATPSHAALGGPANNDTRNAISSDGSLVVWTNSEGGGSQLYVRDTITGETVQLSAAQSGASGLGEADPVYQTASSDGTRVFFTDTQRLTSDSHAGVFTEQLPDLYVAELAGGAAVGSPLSFTLKDLTPEGEHGESADVLVNAGGGGGVIGASENGDAVYFVANGALTPEATTGHCAVSGQARPAGTTCNLYERAYNGGEWTATKLVAALSTEDAPDWGGTAEPGDLAYMTSRVSPSGQYLAFMSDRSLTGYDNEDTSSKEPGERMDEEVFLYDAAGETLTCASCNPDGSQPTGVYDTREAGQDGLGLVVDRPEIWAIKAGTPSVTDHWLAGSIPGWTSIDVDHAAYQSRYLLDSGRLYFDSPSALVPASTTDKEKVYEFEPDGVGTCTEPGGCVGLLSSGSAQHESAFLDASVNGNSVFFLTAEPLAQLGAEHEFNVYDARVCASESPCLQPPAAGAPLCESAATCKEGTGSGAVSSYGEPASTATEAVSQSSSRTVTGQKPPATVKPPTRSQKLAKALAVCHKLRKRHARTSCERLARRRYGPARKGTRRRHEARRRRR